MTEVPAENLVANLSPEVKADIGRELERVFSSGNYRIDEINGRASRFVDYQRTAVANQVNRFDYSQAGAAAAIVTGTVDRQTQKIAEGQGNLATSWENSQPSLRRQFEPLLADNLPREFVEAYDGTYRAIGRIGDQLRGLLPDLPGAGRAIAGSLSEDLQHLGRFNPDAPELKDQAEAIRSLKRILDSLANDYDHSQRATAERFSRDDQEAISDLTRPLSRLLETIRGARGL